MKKVIWHPKTREIVRTFPKQAKHDLGYLIYQLQQGDFLSMPHSRPMKSVATGAHELRVKDADGIYRAFYFVKNDLGILIFHAFKKKTQKTPSHEIKLGRKFLKELS